MTAGVAMGEQSIESRLQRLEDIEAIKQLKYRYFFCCDRKDPAAVRQCFVDGPARIEFGRVGDYESADELVAVFTELACQQHIVEMHHAQNPQIEVGDDNRATGIWGLYYYMIDTRQNMTTQLGGFYEDQYRRCDDGWRIAASRFTVTSTQILDVSEATVQRIFAGSVAPAAIDDPGKQTG